MRWSFVLWPLTLLSGIAALLDQGKFPLHGLWYPISSLLLFLSFAVERKERKAWKAHLEQVKKISEQDQKAEL